MENNNYGSSLDSSLISSYSEMNSPRSMSETVSVLDRKYDKNVVSSFLLCEIVVNIVILNKNVYLSFKLKKEVLARKMNIDEINHRATHFIQLAKVFFSGLIHSLEYLFLIFRIFHFFPLHYSFNKEFCGLYFFPH